MDFIAAIDRAHPDDKQGREYQVIIETLRVEYEGQPVREVKAALQQAWLSVQGASFDDAQLTALAEAISGGRPIKLPTGV